MHFTFVGEAVKKFVLARAGVSFIRLLMIWLTRTVWLIGVKLLAVAMNVFVAVAMNSAH